MIFFTSTEAAVKAEAIRIESEAAAVLNKTFPVALLLTTLKTYPGLAAIIGAFGVACGIIGHLV